MDLFLLFVSKGEERRGERRKRACEKKPESEFLVVSLLILSLFRRMSNQGKKSPCTGGKQGLRVLSGRGGGEGRGSSRRREQEEDAKEQRGFDARRHGDLFFFSSFNALLVVVPVVIFVASGSAR